MTDLAGHKRKLGNRTSKDFAPNSKCFVGLKLILSQVEVRQRQGLLRFNLAITSQDGEGVDPFDISEQRLHSPCRTSTLLACHPPGCLGIPQSWP